jgi:NADPH-dependent F420 reductase
VAGPIAVLGGTGKQGRGLALRLAQAGRNVLVGSRDAARAETAAKELSEYGDVRGGTNAEVTGEADVVIVSVPYDALEATLRDIGPVLEGRLAVSCVNALGFDGGPHALDLPAGSSAEQARTLVPGARWAAAFHTVSAAHLLDPECVLAEDVPVCADDPDDRREIVALVDSIEGLRGIEAGGLHQSATLEALTALCIVVNKRYRTSSGIRFSGVDTTRA